MSGDSDAWFAQFPEEIRTQYNVVQGLLQDANRGYESAQHLVDSRGFSTLRQRNFLYVQQEWAEQQYRISQPSVAAQWKCYRCYRMTLPVST